MLQGGLRDVQDGATAMELQLLLLLHAGESAAPPPVSDEE